MSKVKIISWQSQLTGTVIGNKAMLPKNPNDSYLPFMAQNEDCVIFKNLGYDEHGQLLGNCTRCNTKGIDIHTHKCNNNERM